MMTQRKIVQIDEEKCDGCGQCVPSCAEGAIRIIDGKAKLVSDVYCDGLGACLGECPQDAIRIVQREAEPFDQDAAERRLAQVKPADALQPREPVGCPGAAVRDMGLHVIRAPAAGAPSTDAAPSASALRNWPVQLSLVPPHAPFLRGADLLLVADCVPFALADFHARLLRERPVLVGCPKLDNPQSHVERLAAILTAASIKSLTVIHMEVPCCMGLVRIAEAALAAADGGPPLETIVVSIRGEIIDR